MKKNLSGQTISAQLVSKTDGSAVTSGTTTVYITGDNGTQTQGSVSSGAATHKGNGEWTYAPSQAETNFDHITFTFVNSSAINTGVQVYPTFPQTGDSYARLGAPAGASVSADIAAIEAQTDDIGVAGAGLTAMPWNAAWDAEVQSEVADALAAYDPPTNAEMEARTLLAASYATAAALATVDGNVDAILTDTGTTLPGTLATIAGYLDTEIAAIKAVTDLLPDAGALSSLATAASIAALPTAAENATAVLTTAMTESYSTDGSTMTVAQALYEINQMLQEKSVASTTLTVKKRDGSTSAMTFTLDDATSPTSITRAT